jgi:hypothetical protein
MSNLGRPKPHSARQIRERREKVLILISKGYHQTDIAKELHVDRNTVMRDIKELNQWTRRGLYDMAKQSLSTMLYSCLIGLNEAEKEAWRLYNNENNDPEFSNWHKMAALRLLIDINKSKFRMFSDGPAFMEIGRLQSELGRIKETYLKDNKFRPFVKPSSSSSNNIDRDTLVNADGIPYRIERFNADSSQSQQEQEEKEEEETEDSESDKPKEDHE